jgi:hydrogenase/urease accessory protein HupE
MNSLSRRLAVAGLFVASASVAEAHPGPASMHIFDHPAFGPEFIFAVLALGFLAFQLRGKN